MFAVDHIGDHAGAGRGGEAGVPENFTVGRVEGNDVVAVAGEEEITCGGEHGNDSVPAGPIVTPGGFPGFVIDGEKCSAFAACLAVDSGPAFGSGIGVGEIEHAVAAGGANVEQAGLRIEAGHGPVGCAAGCG